MINVTMFELVPNLPDKILLSFYKNEHLPIQQELLELSERNVAEKKAVGQVIVNSERVALTNIVDKNGVCAVTYQPVWYFDNVATNGSLDVVLSDGQTVRQKYGGIETHNTVDGFNQSPYARLVGVTSVLLTSDEQVILQRRSAKTAIVADNMHVSIAEGMWIEDVDEHGDIDPVATVIRGLHHELGYPIDRVLFEQSGVDIAIVALGISSQYLQPDYVARAFVPATAYEVLEMAKEAKGKWENVEVRAVPFNVESVEGVIAEGAVWSPHALFALKMTLYEDTTYVSNGDEMQRYKGNF